MASNEYNIDDKYTIVVEEQDTFQLELNKQGPQGERGPIGPVGPQGDKGEKGDQGIQGEVGPKGDTGVSVVGVEEISKVGLVAIYRMTFSNGEYFDYEVSDGSIDNLTREQVISLIGYEPASYTSVEGLTTRVATLEERVEDLTNAKFPNVVIIGAPHIEGGQVSNFSSTDYLQFPFVDISRGLPFDIYFSFTTGSDVTTQQNILDSYFGIALAIQNSKGVMALSSNGTSWDIGNVTGTNTILPNTTYYVKCSWTGTQYNASLSTNDTTYVPDMVLNSTLTTNKTTIFIGCSPDLFGAATAHPFKGTINFNKSRVDVQGTTVWKGMADVGLASRANVSLNNLDEVGEKRFTDIQIALDSKQDKGTSGSGLELCDIGMALYVDETKGLRRYLNGQIVDINTNTQEFLDRLLEIKNTNPELFTTESNWQSEALLNIDGCVYKFVLNYASNGETVVSVRLPKYPDYVEINAGGTLPVVGNGMTLGVTDGTKNFGLTSHNVTTSNGMPFDSTVYGKVVGSTTSNRDVSTQKSIGLTTDPTKTGIETTLKQTKLKMRYFIQIATGSETENNIINDIELNNPYSLFECKYSDHELFNLSWLVSNGTYNGSNAVHPSAYQALLVENNAEVAIGSTMMLPNGTEYTKRGLSVKLSTDSDITDYDFVVNTSTETFRLPIKTNLASGNRVVGNGMTLGWTDGTNFAGTVDATLSTGINYYGLNVGQNVVSGGGLPNNISLGITTDPTKSGIELSDSGLYLYFYVGETVQNANLIDAGRMGEQVASLIPDNSSSISGLGMPSNKYIDLTLGASRSTYTAPANGWFYADAHCNASGHQNLLVNITKEISIISPPTTSSFSFNNKIYIPVQKNDIVEYAYTQHLIDAYSKFRFIYAEGEI